MDVPTKVPRYQGRTFTGAREKFWPDASHASCENTMLRYGKIPNALPVITNEPHGYQPELNPGSMAASPSP